MSVVTLSTQRPVVALVVAMPDTAREVMHATDPNDVFAPLCGAYYTSAQTVAIAPGLHAAPISCAKCMKLAPYPQP